MAQTSLLQRADVGTPFMHDRQIMRATLLRGTHVTCGSDVCGSISHRTTAKEGQRRLRTSLKVARWEQVMRAGLAKYRVGELVEARDSQAPYRFGTAFVRLALPADGDVEAATAFSNRLVQLCQLTYAAIVEAAVRTGEKTVRKARDGPSTGDAPGEVGTAPVGDAVGEVGNASYRRGAWDVAARATGTWRH